MLYKIVEIFESLQGEGDEVGAPVTFVRLAGCNLICPFCDTDHSSFSLFDIPAIINLCKSNYVVITGGEPALYDLRPLCMALKIAKKRVGLETNGTLPIKNLHSFDHISFSPKSGPKTIAICFANSLKILFPYLSPVVTASDFSSFPAVHKFIQPVDGDTNRENLLGAIAEVQRLGWPWRLSPQVHKFLNLK